MVYGFRIVEDMISGLSNFMDQKGYRSICDFQGSAIKTVTDWRYLNLNHIDKAFINQETCIKCGRCHIACEDTSHQAITATRNGAAHYEVNDAECVGCNLCASICPVPNCITMRAMKPGEIDPRTGKPVSSEYANWTTHPNNPMRTADQQNEAY